MMNFLQTVECKLGVPCPSVQAGIRPEITRYGW
jgi:hypothetical protein